MTIAAIQGNPGPESGTAMTILIIDDDGMMRQLLARPLKAAGYDVIEAENGRDALRGFAVWQPALVITDVFMPEQDGLETIKLLHGYKPRPRIIAISGGGYGGQMDLLHVASVMGAEITLHKPFTPAALLAAVRELIGRPENALVISNV